MSTPGTPLTRRQLRELEAARLAAQGGADQAPPARETPATPGQGGGAAAAPADGPGQGAAATPASGSGGGAANVAGSGQGGA
ncbi:hypothetical protein HGA03_16140, partial [Cellulomonas denverensis]|nr:hypothetical protein [Cellulomonas denverensis]